MIPRSQHFLEVVSNIFIYAHVHTQDFWAMQYSNSIHAPANFHHQKATAPLPTTHPYTSQASEQLQVQTS